MEKRSRRLRWIPVLATVWLGAVLVLAAVGKALDPIVFVQHIKNEGLDFLLTANQVAVVALSLEVFLGLGLLLLGRHLILLVPTAGLVSFFLFLTGRNYLWVLQGLRDPKYECGCFGLLVERTASEAFWQDLFILVPATVLAFWGARRAWQAVPRLQLASGLAGGLFTAFYLTQIAELPSPVVIEIPRQQAQGNFVPARGFEVYVDGKPDDSVAVFESADSPKFLLFSEGWDAAILLDVLNNRVATAARRRVTLREDQSAEAAAAAFEPESEFEVGADGLVFDWSGRRVEVKTRQEIP